MAPESSRAQPLTLLPPVSRLWALWLRASWPGAERLWPLNAVVKRPLYAMRFIHFAHWGLLTRMPPKGGARLPFTYIVFTTNFNGDVNAYLDAFSILIPGRMRLLWSGAHAFPGPEPLGRFRHYVTSRVVATQHYWCAYPEASLKMIVAGLALEQELGALVRGARKDDPQAFARRWEAWVAEHGNAL